MGKLEVRIVPNRGRDISPLFCTFSDQLCEYDFFAHIHTKKSIHDKALEGWRVQLLNGLFLNSMHVRRIFALFENKRIGMVYPQAYSKLPSQWNTWGANRTEGEKLCRSIGIQAVPEGYIEFPAGSMFWCRCDALKAFLRLPLSFESFEAENTKADGTLSHAIERVFGLAVQKAGYEIAVLPNPKIG